MFRVSTPLAESVVDPHGVGNRGLVLGEGGGVQDDGVVAGAFTLEVAQLIEDVGFARRQVANPIGQGVGRYPLDGVG